MAIIVDINKGKVPDRSPLWQKVVRHLTFYVLLAIIAGILLGHYYPKLGIECDVLGTRFVDLIKIFIGPIIFFTVVSGIGAMGNLGKVGRIGLKSLIYFEVVTTLSLAIGIGVALLVKPGHIDREGLISLDASKYLKPAAHKDFSIWEFLGANFTIVVLALAIACGIILTMVKNREKILKQVDRASKLVFKALRYVMYLAPLGAFGGMASAVGKYGLATLIPLGKLVLCVYATMAFFVLVVLGGILYFYRLSIFKFLRFIQEEILVVVGTSSSESAMPGLMDKLEKLGAARSVVGLVVPTGYSFNLDGTSIYLSMAVIFLAQLFNVELSFSELLSLIGILMLTSKGAAGVTGSGFAVLASTLLSMKTIPVEGLAFLLGVDKFMSEARAITNIIGNGVATLVIAKSEKALGEAVEVIQV
jgi:aerobic C4-dicarboxylate transport protein